MSLGIAVVGLGLVYLYLASSPANQSDNPFAELEEEMRHATTTGYLGENSPNRMDALVWAFTELFLTPNADGWIAWMKERSEAAKGKK